MRDEALERLLKNYYNSRKSWEGWCYLNNIDLKNSKPEIRKYANENKLLYHLRYLLLKDVHIELYKIIKNNNRNTVDNIFMLLNKNPKEKAKEHLSKMKEFETEIKSLTDARDKFYAHLDPDYQDFLSPFEIESYYTIFELVEEAIIILGYEKELLEVLEKIPSRDEFNLQNIVGI